MNKIRGNPSNNEQFVAARDNIVNIPLLSMVAARLLPSQPSVVHLKLLPGLKLSVQVYCIGVHGLP